MKVDFFHWPEHIASGRIRGSLIQAELDAMGVERGRDIIVASKHGWNGVDADKVVFDVCDDHFGGHHDTHYRTWCQHADAVTCNTPAMADIIRRETGRDAIVVPDCYEQPEKPARIADRLLWFGHASNLPDLRRALHLIHPHPLVVVTNSAGAKQTEWTPKAMDAAFDDAGMVVIPTGTKQAKSANRAVESIRRGLFVVAEPLPSYAELGIWVGNLRDGIEWALSHQDEVIRRIKSSQAYVREEFSPRRVALKWLDVFNAL